jgi:hypothetical protein
MNKFQNVETATLVEMLAQHTQQLTSMLLSAVNTKEFADCKIMIAQLQSEINLRRTQSENTTSTRPDVPSQTDTTI